MLALAPGAAPAAQAGDADLLRGQWHLDEGGTDGDEASSTPDSSGHGLTAIVRFAPAVEGRFGGAFSIGSSSLVRVADTSVLEPPQVTLLAWVRRNGDPGPDRYIAAKGAGPGCDAASYALFSGNSDAPGLRFYVRSGGTVSFSPSGGTSLWNGQWHLVAGTYDGSSVRLYVDGEQAGSGTAAGGPIDYELPTGAFDIGHFPGGSLLGGECNGVATHFPGAIDETRVYGRALTATEVARLASDSGPNPPALEPDFPAQEPTPPAPGAGAGSSPAAAFTAPSRVKARQLIVLDATTTRGADRLLWDIDGDGRNDLATGAEDRYLGLRLGKRGVYDVRLTAVGDDGAVSVIGHRVSVDKGRTRRLTAQPPDLVLASPDERFLKAAFRRDHPCFFGVKAVFGVVEAEGCLRHVLDPEDIPPAERPVADEYFTRNSLRRVTNRCQVPGYPVTCVEIAEEEGLDVFVSERPVEINGITFSPRDGAAIVLFPALGRIVSSNATLTLEGSFLPTVRLPSGPLNLDVDSGVTRLSGGGAKLRLFSFDARRDLPAIGGFPLVGQTDVSFVKQGERRFTRWGVQLALPSEFSLFGSAPPSGGVALEADNDHGLLLGNLDLRVPEAYLGGLRLANVSFRYNRSGDQAQGCPAKWWKATADIFLGVGIGDESGAGLRLSPPPTRNGVAFCAGRFHSAGGEFVFGLPIPPPEIFPGVFLDAIDFNLLFDSPTVLVGGATISAGKLVTAQGDLLAAFASPGAPYVVQAEDVHDSLAGERLTSTSFAVGGVVGLKTPVESINPLHLGSAYFLYSYPGYVAAGGDFHQDLLFFSVDAGMSLKLSVATRRFELHGGGRICLLRGIEIEGIGACAGAEVWISSRGAVACFDVLGARPGIGYHWGAKTPDIFLGVAGDGCKQSRYWEAGIQASASARGPGHSGPLVFKVRPGERVKNVELTGIGGAPAVKVRAPDGETLVTEPDKIKIGARLRTLAQEEADRTYIGVEDAEPGRYTITLLSGSAPIARMAATRPEPKAGIESSVEGRGRQRLLRYDVGRSAGRRVTFIEQGKAVWRPLGSAKRGKGTIRFTPAPGASRHRQILAQVEVDGVPSSPLVLGAFRAAPAKPGRPGSVRLRRRGTELRISWGRAANATAYGVRVRQRNGTERVLRLPAGRQRARLRNVLRTQGGAVEVRALGPLGEWGPAGRAQFGAAARPHDRLLPFSDLGRSSRQPRPRRPPSR